MGEKGGAGGGGGDSPPEVDPADDATNDIMAENGVIPEELSPVELIPLKELPLPVSLPLTKKQSPAEREKTGGREREGIEEALGSPDSHPSPGLPACPSRWGAWLHPLGPHPLPVRGKERKKMDGRKLGRGTCVWSIVSGSL